MDGIRGNQKNYEAEAGLCTRTSKRLFSPETHNHGAACVKTKFGGNSLVFLITLIFRNVLASLGIS